MGDYELLDEIARGGMGVVYRARQISLNRLVALKMIRDSQSATPNAVKRFQLEAEAHKSIAAALQDPIRLVFSSRPVNKVPCFANNPRARLREADFGFRSGDGEFTLYCERLNSPRKRIRKAWALGIRGRGRYSTSGLWVLDKTGTRWTFYLTSMRPHRLVGSVASHEVEWAGSEHEGGPPTADFEMFDQGTITRWKIVRRRRQCIKCEIEFEHGPRGRKPLCPRCQKDQIQCWGEFWKLPQPARMQNLHLLSEWQCNERFCQRARRDSGAQIRWVREFTAQGSHTRRQFRELCEKYGSVCLRWGERGPLVADHVVPLAKGGTDDIANIQPLCKICHGIKGMHTTDYRKASSRP